MKKELVILIIISLIFLLFGCATIDQLNPDLKAVKTKYTCAQIEQAKSLNENMFGGKVMSSETMLKEYCYKSCGAPEYYSSNACKDEWFYCYCKKSETEINTENGDILLQSETGHFVNSRMVFDYYKNPQITVLQFNDSGIQTENGNRISILREGFESIFIDCLDYNTTVEKLDESLGNIQQSKGTITFPSENFDYSKGWIRSDNSDGFDAKLNFYKSGRLCRIDVFAKQQKMDNPLIIKVLSSLNTDSTIVQVNQPKCDFNAFYSQSTGQEVIYKKIWADNIQISKPYVWKAKNINEPSKVTFDIHNDNLYPVKFKIDYNVYNELKRWTKSYTNTFEVDANHTLQLLQATDPCSSAAYFTEESACEINSMIITEIDPFNKTWQDYCQVKN